MKRCGFLASFCLLLSGCFENEKACRDRLVEDFNGTIEFAKSESCKTDIGELECANYAFDASKSALQIMEIEIDDDQDACDFVSDGAYLKRQ